jgi:hypothetical protein
VDLLTLTIILYLFRSLHQYHISKLSSTPFMLLSISLYVVYTVNLPVVRPRSCRVIYYFDTPTLGRRHQSFGRVMFITYGYTNKICMSVYFIDDRNYSLLNTPIINAFFTVYSFLNRITDRMRIPAC